MSLIADALAYLIGLGEKSKIGTVIDETTTSRTIVGPGQVPGLATRHFPLSLVERDHILGSIESFLEYLKSPHAKGPIAVFVGPTKVVANLDYRSPTPSTEGPMAEVRGAPQVISLPLVPSKEWVALERLGEGVSQKALWRLLVSDLAGTTDPELLASIATLATKKTAKAAEVVDQVGISQLEGGLSIAITVGGQESQSIKTSHFFNVRPWEGLETKICIETALEIDPDRPDQFFTFHPRSIDMAIIEARRSLRTLIADEVGRPPEDPFPVLILEGKP